MSELRFLFVGGGTGGHLTPALGLAEALRRRGHRCRFLTSGRAVENGYLGDAGDHVSLGLEGGRLPRRLLLAPALGRARRQAREFQPDLVVGLGGLTGSAALAARRRRPLVLLEGNRVVGRGVRWLQPWCEATLTLFEETARELRTGVHVGPIVRRSLAPLAAAAARERLGLAPDRPVLLVTGGSQGARDLNRFAATLAPDLARRGWQLLALCGAGRAADLGAATDSDCPTVVLEHCRDMGAAYSAADLALCRGGAGTVAELWLHRLPALVVPYPYHKDRQQEHNARTLEPGVMVESDLDEAGRARVLALVDDEARRRSMARHLADQAPPEGSHRAASLLEEMAVRNQ